MKIKYLEFSKREVNDWKRVNFHGKSILIHSNSNSKGKTTLVRLLLYAMGYPVPSTQGVRFQSLKTKVCIERDDDSITIERSNDSLKINNEKNEKITVFTLPMENTEVLSFLYGFDQPSIVQNILGISYFDQDKGWTLLNRGIVIGKIRFKIEDLIEGLSGKNFSDLIESIGDLRDKNKSYQQIKSFLTTQRNTVNVDKEDIAWSTIDDLQNKIRSIDIQIKQLKNRIASFEEVVKNNKKYVDMIDSMGITITVNEEKVMVSKDNLDVKDLEVYESMFNAKISRLWEDIQPLRQRKKLLVQNLNTQMQLVTPDEQVNHFTQEVNKISLSMETIDKRTKENSKKIRYYQRLLNDRLRETDETQDIYNTIQKYASILGIEDTLDKKLDFIFTSNLKRYSGAKLHLLVFAFRLALLKKVQKGSKKTFPIIIDSLRSGEIDERNVEKMLQLLSKEFPDNQLIMASIYNYKKDWDTVIELKTGIMNDNY